ncbi:LuxR family transcriptional regulator [Rhodococcus kroppenstedtii]|uniref:helix-turn-helix transcriptional regulator n=1 Tax=Rhodococcoides kroppenstedtii TaxID=293050 RepID=UPI0027E0CB08|nr:helix-turn-helix transcriptional regulator [Rhodococcus kroppenstedtii]MBY6437598.1 LuxR family transcriptional regulator [Rhodococcus kroppenstedtii]
MTVARRPDPATALRAALIDRGVDGDAVDGITLEALAGCEIDVDDPSLCAAALLDLGPAAVVDALQNGTGWAGFAERLSGALAEVGDVRGDAARDVLWSLHLAAGATAVATLRAVLPDTDVDAGIAELASSGVVRVVHPSAGGATSGSRVALRLSGIGDAVREARGRLLAGHAETMPAATLALDLRTVDDVRAAAADTARSVPRVVEQRRAMLVAVDRLAAVGRWSDVVALVDAAAPALAAVGLHRELHRRVQGMLGSAQDAPDDVRTRLRAISADLHLASGDTTLCRHLLAASAAPDERAVSWRADLLAAVWAVHVDDRAVLAAVDRFVAGGGSPAAAAQVALDLAARLFGDGRTADAQDVLTVAGVHAAVAGDPLTLARLHVTEAALHARTGESAVGRRRVAAAYPLAASHGDHAFVHVLASCVRPLHGEPGVEGVARVADVLDLAAVMDGVDVDRRRVLADVVADVGVGLRGATAAPVPVSAAAMLRSLYGQVAGGVSGVTGPGPERLTDREQQVAELVATGLGNTEIGARLGISRWTVVSHLRNIMRKWDCASRVEVALQYRDGEAG